MQHLLKKINRSEKGPQKIKQRTKKYLFYKAQEINKKKAQNGVNAIN